MKRPEDMTLEELREDLKGRLISPAPEEMEFDELVEIKEEMDAEELRDSLVWKGFTSKDKLLKSIHDTMKQYEKLVEIAEKEEVHKWQMSAFPRAIYKTLKQFESKVRKADLPELIEDFCGYTYKITCTGIVLRVTPFEWSGTECGRGEEKDIFQIPLVNKFIGEYGYEMEGDYVIYDS